MKLPFLKTRCCLANIKKCMTFPALSSGSSFSCVSRCFEVNELLHATVRLSPSLKKNTQTVNKPSRDVSDRVGLQFRLCAVFVL